MGTNVVYNGVTLQNVLTRDFKEVSNYDESGMDQLFHQFRIRVMGYVHSTYPSSTVGFNISGGNPANVPVATLQSQLRLKLMEARKEFVMTVGGTEIIHVIPPSTDPIDRVPVNADVNGGPKPQSCSIVHIAGSGLIRVEFEIELAIVECESPSNNYGVLSNRWSMADSINENFYTTRTITGRLRLADVNLHAQSFRSWCVPPLQGGFRRQSINVVTTTDGLNLEYTVVDEEMYASPPFPGTKWEAFHTVSSGDGLDCHVELTIRLEGPKNTPKKELIQACGQVCFNRLDLANDAVVIESAAIIDHMHESIVEMRVQVQQFPKLPLETYGFTTLHLGDILNIEDYDRETWLIPKEYGTATPTGLFIAYLQSPCNDRHKVGAGYHPPVARGDAQAGEPAPEITITTSESSESLPVDDDIEGNYSDSHKEHLYTHYQIDSDYQTPMHKVQMPIARSSEGSTSEEQDTAAFITLAQPVTKRIVHVAAERYGAAPEIPKPQESVDLGGGVTATLLDWSMNAKAPKLTADNQTQLFSIDATFEYGLNRPVSSLAKIPVGALPWGTKSLDDNAFDQASFKEGII